MSDYQEVPLRRDHLTRSINVALTSKEKRDLLEFAQVHAMTPEDLVRRMIQSGMADWKARCR